MPEEQTYLCQQEGDTFTTGCQLDPFHIRYAFARSYASLMSGQASGEFIGWQADEQRFVFAICSGMEGSEGQVVARFLGERLLDWLWSLTIAPEDSADDLKGQINWNLSAWAERAQGYVLALALPEDGAEQVSEQRSSRGGETTFLCGSLSASEDGPFEAIFAWAGNSFLRCYDGHGGRVQFDPVRSTVNRWSSILGKRGSVNLVRLGPEFDIQRVVAFSDGLTSLENEVADMPADRLQRSIEELVVSGRSDDIAYIDIWHARLEPVRWNGGRTESTLRTASPRLHFNQNLLDSGGLLVWNHTEETVYAVLQAMDQSEKVRTLYVGREPQFSLPNWPTEARYRVGLYCPMQVIWSNWWPEQEEDAGRVAENELDSELFEEEEFSPPVGDEAESMIEAEAEADAETDLLREEEPPRGSLVPFTEELLRTQEETSEKEPTQVVESVEEEEAALLEPPAEALEQAETPEADIEVATEAAEAEMEEEPGYAPLENLAELPATEPVAEESLAGSEDPFVAVEEAELPQEPIRLVEPGVPDAPTQPLPRQENTVMPQPVPIKPRPRLPAATGLKIEQIQTRLGGWMRGKLKPVEKKAPDLEESIFQCSSFEDLYGVIGRYLQGQNIRLQRLRLEQRSESGAEYRNVDSRQTTEIYSLNIYKGPDYRLTMWGAREERLVSYITFDRMKWTIQIRFEPVQREQGD